MPPAKYRYFIDGVEYASPKEAALAADVPPELLHICYSCERPTCRGHKIDRIPIDTTPYEARHYSVAVALVMERADRMRYGGGLLPRVEVCP